MKGKKILIIGCAGCGNAGDDAILEGLYFLYNKAGDISAILGEKDEYLSSLGINIVTYRLLRKKAFTPFIVGVLVKFPKVIFSIKSCDYLFIGGGSLLHDLTKYNLPFFFLLQIIASFFRKPVYYTHIGIGPISTKYWRKNIHKYLNRSEGVYSRDTEGVALLKKLGVNNVKFAPDPAFSIMPLDSAADDILKEFSLCKKTYITFTCSSWFKSTNYFDWIQNKNNAFSNESKFIADSIVALIHKYKMPVVFLPTIDKDHKLGLELQKTISSEFFHVINADLGNRIYTSIIANSHFLVGMRMHSMIFAITACTPFVAIDYDQKVTNLLKMFEMSDYSISVDDLSKGNIDILMNVIERLELDRIQIINKLQMKLDLLRAISLECSDEIINSFSQSC